MGECDGPVVDARQRTVKIIAAALAGYFDDVRAAKGYPAGVPDALDFEMAETVFDSLTSQQALPEGVTALRAAPPHLLNQYLALNADQRAEVVAWAQAQPVRPL